MTKRAVIKQSDKPEELVPVEILARQIGQLATAAKRLEQGPLTRRCIVVLLKDMLGNKVSKEAIESVIDALPNLERTYVRAGKAGAA